MNNQTLKETDAFLSSLVKKPSKEPTEIEYIFYLLATEFGITNPQDYPMPYLQGLIKTYTYLKNKEIAYSKRKK
jgi:hypothetical protein